MDLIEQLGGHLEVAKALGLAGNRVWNWRERGIPWRFRPTLAEMASEKGIKVPRDFLNGRAA